MERKYKQIAYYPGIELQEDALWLKEYLRKKGLSFSQIIRPAVEDMIRKYKAEAGA